MKKYKLDKVIIKIVISIAGIIFVMSILSVKTIADDGAIQSEGLFYEFDKNSKYECSTEENYSLITEETETYGSFSVAGEIVNIDKKDGIPLYGTENGTINFTYTYTDKLLNAAEEEWHLVSDSGKEVDGISLESKIENGAIIIQTSKDGSQWVDTYSSMNVFEAKPVNTDSFYTATDIQLKNGCFYKIYIVYELCRKIEPKKILFFSIDEYEYKKCAECYILYAYDVDAAIANGNAENDLKYSFSEKINTGLDNGYSGNKEIDKNDPHFGWDLGEFIVRGFSRSTKDNDGTPVFMKNTGDQVVLYFNLKQNIDSLNGNDALTISSDNKGYDKYFEIPQTYMGRGTLIIKYTNYENITHDPIVYTDYLAANISPGADTEVQLCDEGDYEVSLDYEIKNNKREALGVEIFPEYSNYKIFFRFSIRNGKCMVYPMDAVTGSDLSNSSYTANGFTLDLAYSRYLELSVKKEVLNRNNELQLDEEYNDLAKNGSTFIEEGLYTITARNQYTDQTLTKVIYVGEDERLKACAKTGMPFGEVNDLINRGATIDKYGDLDLTNLKPVDDQKTNDHSITNTNSNSNEGIIGLYIFAALVLIIIVLIIVIACLSRSRKKHKLLADELRQRLKRYE